MTRAAAISSSIIAVFATSATYVNAQTVWTGPDTSITQSDNAPQSVTDVIIPGIAELTRGNVGPLCNTALGDPCVKDPTNPSGIEFAFSGLSANAPFAYGNASNFAGLIFNDLSTSLANSIGNNIVGRPVVGHVVASDVYSGWQMGAGGGFAYRRSTVPEPSTLMLAMLTITGLAARSRPA